jgi:hypothetical protein
MASTPPHRILLVVLCAAPFFGCEVDHRTLQGVDAEAGTASSSGRSGSGGMHAAGRAGAGAMAGSATMPVGGAGGTLGGTGGAGSAGVGAEAGGSALPELVDGCVDLDQNKVGDCSETLVKNAVFATDVDNWNVGVMPLLAWSDQNRAADTPSGSALISFESDPVDADGLAESAAAQCVPVSGGKKLVLRANAYIESDQGEGLAGLGVWFYEQDDCSGPALTPFEVIRAETDTWLTLSGSPDVPANATSMVVRLTVSKPQRQEAFEVVFDNVLVRTK